MELDLESINRLAKIHNLPEATRYSPDYYESDVPIVQKPIAIDMNEPPRMINTKFTRFVFRKVAYKLNREIGYCYVLATNVKEDKLPPVPNTKKIRTKIKKRELTEKQKRKSTLKELNNMPFDLVRIAKKTYYENISLKGSMCKYDSFIDYFEAEILEKK